jgi:6-pyruvoyltetrahydropterin/6-carboxytetrahydropterin synthase
MPGLAPCGIDHKSLNHQVPGLTKRPKTTESLAQYLHGRVAAVLPIHRVRLHERDDFFAEYWEDGGFFLGMQRPFSAAHRLHAASLSEAENHSLYGKCNNPRGPWSPLSDRSDDRRPLRQADRNAVQLLRRCSMASKERSGPWQDKHLDLETEEFRTTPSTGENIVRVLWPKFCARLDDRLTRLRLWETPNNRFTLRCR